MSPQRKTIGSISKRLLLLIVFSGVSIFLIKGIYSLGMAQPQDSSNEDSQTQDKNRINGKLLAERESKEQRTSFSESGPLGQWSASFIPDFSRNSSNSPVVITGTSTLMGNAQWRNLQLTHVTLKNYSSKTVLGVQLKWFVTTRAKQTRILPPPGYTGTFEAHLQPGDSQRVESPLVKFSQAVKYLVKNGILEGDFLVQLRMYQVEFDDGTSWNDDWGGPKPGERGERWQGATEPKSLQNHVSSVLQGACQHTLCSYNTPDSHSICEVILSII
jgi:hypothetical protein